VKHFNHARNKEIIDSLLAKIVELEKERDEHEMAYETIVQALNKCYDIVSKDKNNSELSKQLCLMIGYTVPSELLEIRDLEQQAAGLENWDYYHFDISVTAYASQLREQAKGGAE
jgi:hypothetical protein